MKYILILVVVFLYNLNANNLKGEIDYCVFYLPNDSISINIYYEFNSKNLEYSEIDSNLYISKIFFEAELKSVLNEYKFNWELSSAIDNLKTNFIVFGRYEIKIPNEQVNLVLKFYNPVNRETEKKINKDIISSTDKHLSDIYFATRIEHKDSTEIGWSKEFLINDYYIIPNASKQFFSDNPRIMSYIELNNTKSLSDSMLKIEYKILDGVKSVKKIVNKYITTSVDIKADIAYIPVPDLATGVYFLEVNIFNEKINKSIESSTKKLFYLNYQKEPELQAKFSEDELFERSEYITMTAETLKKEYDKIKFLMTKTEESRWKDLSEEKAKQRALFNFWRVRDSDTTTYFNEAKDDFDKAVKYADEYFSFSKGFEGWRTDRGRVLLKYGFPMQVERFERRGEQIPCEIWYYGEGGGGAYFYFVDKSGYNNFILVHSTVFGENQNENWVQEFNPAITNMMNVRGNPNFR
jgi:GWxTD domain-containing protein